MNLLLDNNYTTRLVVLMAILLLPVPEAQAAAPIPLRAGPLTMIFEPDNAFLRYVNVGPHEVLRGINAPVRDQFWGTVQPEVSNLDLDKQEDNFTLTFDASCREGDVDFFWRGTIRGSAEGKVELVFDGVARSTFLRNRIGFCVLHGPSAAGRPMVVENPEGEMTATTFPTFISPHQPAKDIRAITHEVTPDIRATVRFTGEVFEMEDQRNWTDASFKTYCTPLAIPYPVRVNEGDRVYQRVVLNVAGDVHGEIEGSEQPTDDRVQLTLGDQRFPIPRLGLKISSEIDELTEKQLRRLQTLKLDHLRVDLTPADEHFAAKMHQAASQAEALNVSLHAGVRLGENPEERLRRLSTELEKVRPPISVWLVNEADQELLQLARKYLKPHGGDAAIGISQDTNFVELNRARPEDEQIDVVSYGVNPQIHAIDNASIIETLPIQGDTVRSAKQFIGDRQLIVGPITFRPQPIDVEPAPGELPSNVDARQPSLFLAGWTLGSIKYLAEAGAGSATYYETVGWKGIMEADHIPPRGAAFPSNPGEVFAVYHVLRNLADFADGEIMALASSDPLSVVGTALTNGKETSLLVANLTNQEKSITISGLGERVNVLSFDSQNSKEANSDPESFHARLGTPWSQKAPLVLAPHSIVRIQSAAND